MRFFIATLLIGFSAFNSVMADNLLGLPPLTIPADNPQTPEKVALGKSLFNDKRFSADGTISCASCHSAKKAFTDNLPVSKGFKGQTGTRNAPSVLNAAFYQSFFWDGRAQSLEEQALKPLTNPIEHGLENHQPILEIIQHDKNYLAQFNRVFNVSENEITINHVAKAIASFERTLIAGNSDFDRYFYGMNPSAISESAARGSRIFRRKGNCAVCHEISLNNALFTDNRFYNVGVGFNKLNPVLDKIIETVNQNKSLDELKLTNEQHSEFGQFAITKQLNDLGKFKTPTLRNIALTAPYMHDGRFKTLKEVIEHYNKGGEKNSFLDPKIFPLDLTPQEKLDLEAFLQSLTSH